MKSKQIKLMTHIVNGYPNLKFSEKLIELMSKYAKYIEIQIPFSDPMADGPSIMRANQVSLDNKIKVEDSFKLMKKMSKKVDSDLLFMCYYNTIFNYGIERFIKKAKRYGAKGLIVPDIPLEEDELYFEMCCKHDLAHIFVVAPNTPEERLKQIGQVAKLFVYCVARLGVTGNKTKISNDFKKYVAKVRKCVDLPLAVGFGIQNKDQVKKLDGYVDIAVIGSHIINLIDEKNIESSLRKIESFLDLVSDKKI